MDKIYIQDGWFSYKEAFFSQEESEILFHKLLTEVPWESGEIKLFGKKYVIPRLQALFGDEGNQYSYSGKEVQRNDWHPLLLELKYKVEQALNSDFNVCLANLYRDGQDSNGWHADNEKSLGKHPLIASLSFGAERLFKLRHNTTKETLDFILKPGSLFVMGGALQTNWKHTLPKTSKKVSPRINLTYREII